MSGFRCPFCNQIFALSNDTNRSFSFDFDGRSQTTVTPSNKPFGVVSMYKCPNSNCGRITLYFLSVRNFAGNGTYLVYPRAVYRHFPDYIPQAIRNDYEEASLILSNSPKAAATLARRCLQGMIRDYWQISGKMSLYAEIDAIKDKVSPAQWCAIDALRKIGNIGAHMEHDVNLLVDVAPDEAEKLLKLIELLIEKWYIARHDEQELLKSIVEVSEAKAEERNAKA